MLAPTIRDKLRASDRYSRMTRESFVLGQSTSITRELLPHPDNELIYGDEELDADFVESIRENGIMEPIVVHHRVGSRDYLIISGHRRWRAAIALEMPSVPAVVLHYDFDMSDAEQRAELIHRNKQREKTVEVRAREYKKLAEANAVIAQERMMAGVKANPLENFTEGSICSKDEAAKAVGMSRPTAEKAAAVVHKIDELEASGEKAKAADLKKTLNNKSVSAAYAKATGKAKPAKLKTIKPKKAKLKVVRPNKKLDFDDAVVDGYFGFLFRAIDERAKILNGKNHVEYKACCKALHEFADHWKAWKKGRT